MRLPWTCAYASIAEAGPDRYYTVDADRVVRQIAEWVTGHGTRQVCFTGVSKAGYGSLLWSTKLAARLRKVSVSALVMAPQALLWPLNPGIHKPSYSRLMADAEPRSPEARTLRKALKKNGHLRDPSRLSNYRARVVYPALYEPDAREARRISWRNAELLGLPISVHNVILPYLWDVSDLTVARTAVDKLVNAAKRDADIASYLTHADPEDLVAEYHALAPHPLLVDAVDGLMAEHAQGAEPLNRELA